MDDLPTELERLQAGHLLRTRRVRSSAQEIEPVIDGKKVLSFCSNDYLGLASHPRITERLVRTASESGVGSGASHLITGHHTSHHALEEELAEFMGCERALLFSTGYMANLGVVGAFAGRTSVVFEDRLNHASLIDAAVLARARLRRYRHLDTEELQQKLEAVPGHPGLIASDGVFSMDGTVCPVKRLQEIARACSARLVIDDAHGIGVLGPHGKGCTEGRLEKDTLVVGTLGKAFGTFGAFVAGPGDSIEWCVQRARSYAYTTALPPPLADAARAALQLIREEPWRRERLQALVGYFRKCAAEQGLPVTASVTPIQPVMTGSADTALRISRTLHEHGILVPAIRPPTVARGQARLRVTFSAMHTEMHIDRLVETLAKALQPARTNHDETSHSAT